MLNTNERARGMTCRNLEGVILGVIALTPPRVAKFADLKAITQLCIYAFFTQALHHPLEETALPPNARHGAVASFAVPWNKVQEAQYWPIVN